MAEPIRYAIVCCTGYALAYIDVKQWRSGSVTVAITDASHRPHLTVAVNPVIDGKPVWAPDEFHQMVTEGAASRTVTEIAWRNHRSWVIRCGAGSCPKQAEISNPILRTLADSLADGAWPVINNMHVVTLGVLNIRLTHLNG